MSNRKVLDTVAGLILAALAAAAAIWIIPEQAAPGDEGEIAPVLLPVVAAGVVAVFAIIQALTTVMRRASDTEGFDARSLAFTLIATTGLAVTVLLFLEWGFRIGGIIAIIAIGLAMRPSVRVAGWLVAVAVVLPLATYTLAWHGLRLALP